MKVSKNLFLLASIAIVLNFSSCGKYEDGPNFSLRTKKSRLAGEWEVVKLDGSDLDPGMDINLEFDKNGDFEFSFKYSYMGYNVEDSYSGKWEWSDKKESVLIDVDGDEMEWEIKRLTNDEFWFEDEDNIEYKCEAK